MKSKHIDMAALDSAPLADPHHYRYAGLRVEEVILPSRSMVAAALNHARKKHSVHPVIPLDGARYMIANVGLDDSYDTIGSHYLLPYYEREAQTYLRQEKRMVQSRISRFFETAQPGIRNEQTSDELLQSIEHFRTTGKGGPKLLGGIMDHLETLNDAILDLGKFPEKLKETTNEHHAKLTAEFRYFYNFLVLGEEMAHVQSKWGKLPACCPQPAIEKDALFQTLTLADGSPDTDGLLHYFAHEVGKVIAVETSSRFYTMSVNDRMESRKVMEKATREAVTRNVAWACEAMDHVNESLDHYLLRNSSFSRFLKNRTAQLPTDDNGMNASHYAHLLADFTRKARARACVRIKDSQHFQTADGEFLSAAAALQEMNDSIRALMPLPPSIRDGVDLLERGVNLITNMAQTRMPRDHHANAFIDDAEGGRSRSSVALLETDLQRWSERPRGMPTARTL